MRRWLAIKRYREALIAKQMSWGALTLQKHARGWLARQKKKKSKGDIPVGEVAPIYRQELKENDTPIKNQNKVSPIVVAENKKTYIQVCNINFVNKVSVIMKLYFFYSKMVLKCCHVKCNRK